MAHILVIDDDTDLRASVVRILERQGHEIVQAGNGLEAMKLFEERQPDLVVTDINMPEMDGIEVISTLRRMKTGVPIVAMSGGGQMPREILLSSAGLLGAVETVDKPFLLSDLVAAVESALGGASD